MPAQQIRRDPVQPRPRVSGGRVITLTGAKSDHERLPRQIIGQLRADPPRQIPPQLPKMPIKDRREPRRITNRSDNQHRVRAIAIHQRILPARPDQVPRRGTSGSPACLSLAKTEQSPPGRNRLVPPGNPPPGSLRWRGEPATALPRFDRVARRDSRRLLQTGSGAPVSSERFVASATRRIRARRPTTP